MPKKDCAFFLGANSKDGFVSFFPEMAGEDDSRRIDFIKSGPGCGKGTLMAKIAEGVSHPNDRVEEFYCSSDPHSLDGVIFHGGKRCLWDATAPHAEEPPFPGACGNYITTPRFINEPLLREKLPALTGLSRQSKEYYKRAYLMLGASHSVDLRITSMLAPYFDFNRLAGRAAGIIAREISKIGGVGTVKKRFLDGITPFGLIRFDSTVEALCRKVYCIEDSWGFSQVILEPLLRGITARGHSVYACYSPKDTSRLLHIIVPELSLAFVTCQAGKELESSRKIRCDAYLNDGAHKLKGKARALKRLSAAMVDDAVEEISSAHLLHDKLEELYRPHIDFVALDKLTATLIAGMK